MMRTSTCKIAAEFIDVSASGDAEKQARLAELKKKLNESMMKLSDQHRAVVTLFDIQGLATRKSARS
jgi:DNA-directed RNA polymerase specialized sigma24 family protein